MRKRTRIIGWVVIAFWLILAVEVGSYALHSVVILSRNSFLSYNPPTTISKRNFIRYLSIRDIEVGWPTTEDLNSSRHDVSGSRPIPAFPEATGQCVSLYGDSFTYAEDVNDEFAWGNMLAEQLGCRVGNFGVNGYGTDQAFLRFKSNISDHAPITVLGIFPHNVLRNVNQNRFLLTGGGSPFLFKPRFVFEDEKLRLIPIPKLKYEELSFFFQDPGVYLKYEAFLPGTDYGPQRFTFPYFLSLVNMLFKERTINWLLNRPSWASFVQAGHPTKAMEITVGIVSEYKKNCAQREKGCLVIIFPTPSSYSWFRENNSLITQVLLTNINAIGIPALDLTKDLSEKLGEQSICDILVNREACTGHFNVEGNRMIGDIVYGYVFSQYSHLLEGEK